MTSAAVPPPGRPSGAPPTGEAPVRTCVGCRARSEVTGLLRVVARGPAVVPDPRRRLPGRGAWLHPDVGCLRLAERRRAFPRALRAAGPLELRAVEQLLLEAHGPVDTSEEQALKT